MVPLRISPNADNILPVIVIIFCVTYPVVLNISFFSSVARDNKFLMTETEPFFIFFRTFNNMLATAIVSLAKFFATAGSFFIISYVMVVTDIIV